MSKARLFFTPSWLDEYIFESVFNEHYTQIYHILFRLLGDPDEADDLAAETFIRLWRQPPLSNENLGGWLYRVALRLGYNHLRSARRRKAYQSQASQQADSTLADSDPEQEAGLRIERQRVRSIFRQMALRDVQVLVLRYSGLSYKEIAAALQIAPGSVGTLLSRAEARFAEQYRREEKDAPER